MYNLMNFHKLNLPRRINSTLEAPLIACFQSLTPFPIGMITVLT